MDKPFERITRRVDDTGGVAVATLGELRDLSNKGRLGRHVLGQIAEELTNCGLGYFPLTTLEDHEQPRACEEIRLYRLETSLATLIESVTCPSETGDEVLRASTGDAATLVQEIRRLVA